MSEVHVLDGYDKPRPRKKRKGSGLIVRPRLDKGGVHLGKVRYALTGKERKKSKIRPKLV